ncbi:uncharacterized membrane protein (DUF485 family) [Nocardioides salarius]|uniref:Uncharacterized membrane protein (DUF485 family) n=1 Tax=Nocardioides salarius TaxID=374513 RepID=A0ABS2MFU3_9ACTN|nr:hypothetical protein [Nocardioides salarius]MBM7510051.1 uncharacterized membrane protein (DUF485 family) [Nocardioides salarius]
MTTTTDRPTVTNSTAVLVIGVLAIAGATIIGVLVAIPESKNQAATLTIVLGFLGTSIPTVLNAVLGKKANKKLDRVLNGEMDRKIMTAVHQVLDEREPLSAVDPTDVRADQGGPRA